MHLLRKYFLSLTIAAGLSILNINVLSAQEAYKDESLAVNERVSDLISRMTLSEKISQIGHKTPAISRLGIPSYNYWNEALHGVARSGLATSFPQAIALSSTWDPELVFEVASATSTEARVKSNTDGKGLTYWCPTINMARDPRWGRAEENYGEDPFLTSKIAVSFIKGMQGNDPKYLKTVATAKHFACNNVEYNRYGISSDVDERNLREYYLPAFKASVVEGGVYSIMSAYNAVNGVPSPANRTLLLNILRNEWGFDGYVVSDCDAVKNVWDPHNYVGSAAEASAISIANGNDLNCGSTFQESAGAAISSGILTETELDSALFHLLRARFLLGEFDAPSSVPYRSVPDSLLDCRAHRELALRAARESIVLLKNENSILPLTFDDIDTISIIGPNAAATQLGGYSGTPAVTVSILQGIADRFGIDISDGTIEAEWYTSQSGIQTESCDEGGSNIGYIENGDMAGYSTVDFGTGKTKLDVRIASATSGGTLNIVLDQSNGTSIGTISVPGTGGWQTWTTITLDIPVTDGIHDVYLKFSGGSGYLYNINWFRFYNPDEDNPLDGKGRIKYARGCDISGTRDQAEFDKAAAFAANSDIAVVVCGTDLSVMDEGHDRNTLKMPGVQEELLKTVYRANPNTILVLVNGGSLLVNWAQDSIPAILSTWYNGQSQGTAFSDVLFGDYNPRGKLTTTWYRSETDLPPMSDYNIRNNRTYMYFKGSPLYPFGHGLSYTNFEYSNLVISSGSLDCGDSVTVSVDIKNTGEAAGDEIVQLYTHCESSLVRPMRELKGFSSVYLEPGESEKVTLSLKHDDLSYYNQQTRSYEVEQGTVNIEVGSSSADIRLIGSIDVSQGIIAQAYLQDPYLQVEAEHFENKSGSIKFGATPGNGKCIQSISNNSYILFKNMDFAAGARQFNAYISSIEDNAVIEILLDSLDGPLAGSLNVLSTGDAENYYITSSELDRISGIHDLFLRFTTSSPESLKVDWFNFQENVGIIASHADSKDFTASIFPNPVDGEINIKYHLSSDNNVSIGLYSTLGCLVRSYNTEQQKAGDYMEQINTSELNPGLYIIHVSSGSFLKSFKMEVL